MPFAPPNGTVRRFAGAVLRMGAAVPVTTVVALQPVLDLAKGQPPPSDSAAWNETRPAIGAASHMAAPGVPRFRIRSGLWRV